MMPCEDDYGMDWEDAEIVKSTRPARAVLSVAFSREEFERLCGMADARGMKVSTFVRETVLAPRSHAAHITGSHHLRTYYVQNETSVR